MNKFLITSGIVPQWLWIANACLTITNVRCYQGVAPRPFFLELFLQWLSVDVPEPLHTLVDSFRWYGLSNIKLRSWWQGTRFLGLTSSNFESPGHLSLLLVDWWSWVEVGWILGGAKFLCGTSLTRPPASPVVTLSSRVFRIHKLRPTRLDSFFRWDGNTSWVVLWLQCSFFQNISMLLYIFQEFDKPTYF